MKKRKQIIKHREESWKNEKKNPNPRRHEKKIMKNGKKLWKKEKTIVKNEKKLWKMKRNWEKTKKDCEKRFGKCLSGFVRFHKTYIREISNQRHAFEVLTMNRPTRLSRQSVT